MTDRLSQSEFHNMFITGVQNILRYYEIANRINVFPVPDADTGTNVRRSLESAIEDVYREIPLSFPEYLSNLKNALNRRALGNSGKIYSVFFEKLIDGLIPQSEGGVSVETLVNAYKWAVPATWEELKRCKFNPKRGTILSVMEASSEGIDGCVDIERVVEKIYSGSIEGLRNTPNESELLTLAGVVDSGGLTWVYMMEGFRNYLSGKRDHHDEFDNLVLKEIKREKIYCFECVIELNHGRGREDLISLFGRLGENVIIQYDKESEIFNCHVHIEDINCVIFLINQLSSDNSLLYFKAEDASQEPVEYRTYGYQIPLLRNPLFLVLGADCPSELSQKYNIRAFQNNMLVDGEVVDRDKIGFDDVVGFIRRGRKISFAKRSSSFHEGVIREILGGGQEAVYVLTNVHYANALSSLQRVEGGSEHIMLLNTGNIRQWNDIIALNLAAQLNGGSDILRQISGNHLRFLDSTYIHLTGDPMGLYKAGEIDGDSYFIAENCEGTPVFSSNKGRLIVSSIVTDRSQLIERFARLLGHNIRNLGGRTRLDFSVAYGLNSSEGHSIEQRVLKDYGAHIGEHYSRQYGFGVLVRQGEDSLMLSYKLRPS